jgi:hypothetical protein
MQKGFAQTNGLSVDDGVVIKHKLWLYNSEGKIAGDQDSVISKGYFNSKWVDVQSDAVYGGNATFSCIVQAKERPQAMVYYFEGTKLSHEVITGIKGWETGGAIIFLVEEKNDETGIKEMRILKFILQ